MFGSAIFSLECQYVHLLCRLVGDQACRAAPRHRRLRAYSINGIARAAAGSVSTQTHLHVAGIGQHTLLEFRVGLDRRPRAQPEVLFRVRLA